MLSAKASSLVLLALAFVACPTAAQTCQFGSLTVQVDQTVCNQTTKSQHVCTRDGSLMPIDQPCTFWAQHCVLNSSEDSLTIVRLGQSVCLNGLVRRCWVQYYRTLARVPWRPRWRYGQRSTGNAPLRYVYRAVYVRVAVLRASATQCEGEGCVLPRVSRRDNVTVLPLNETTCFHGAEKLCDDFFTLRKSGLCSCLFRHRVVQEGETVCDRRLGLQALCVRDGVGAYNLEPNGTCEIQCQYHDGYYSVNHTICHHGRQYICRESGRFQWQGPCTCTFDGTAYRSGQRWCSNGQRYRCDSYGEVVTMAGGCSCRHGGRTYPTGSELCRNSVKYRCQANGSYERIGFCPRACRSGEATYQVGSVICVGRWIRYCHSNGRWYRFGRCQR